MSFIDDMGMALADEALAEAAASGDEKLVDRIATMLGASSQSLEEAYLTGIRVRRAEARAKEEIEGYVVVFDDGHRLKLKTEHYALRHNALASVTLEKNVLEWVLRGSVDDVLPLLAPKIAEIVRNYNDAVHDAITKREQEVVSFVNNNLGLSRKDFAAKAKVNLDPRLAGAAFAILDDRPPRKTLIDNLLKTVGSINRIDTMRDLYGFEWSLDGITLPEA